MKKIKIFSLGQMASPIPTFVFVDYDDTLLPSSVISKFGLIGEIPAQIRADLALYQIGNVSASLLKTMREKGAKVCVITNSETGWARLSAQRYIPEINEELDKAAVISAKDSYKNLYREDIQNAQFLWKFQTFYAVLRDAGLLESQKKAKVISIGDSSNERLASLELKRFFPNIIIQSVKLAEHPTMLELKNQLELVEKCFGTFLAHPAGLDLLLKLNQPPAPSQAGGAIPEPPAAREAEAPDPVPAIAEKMKALNLRDPSPLRRHSRIRDKKFFEKKHIAKAED